MPSCEQFLSSCWWRNADRNCCEIFEVQKTEYGLCYSFNSEMAVTSLPDPTESRPRKASSYGEWSGIKVTIHPGNITKPPDSSKDIGNHRPCNILRVVRRATSDMDRIERVTSRLISPRKKKKKIIKRKSMCAIMSNKLLWKFGIASDRVLIRLPVTLLGIAFVVSC